MDESIKSFIDAKPIGTNIPKYLDEASRSPFILVIGARENPHQVFVIIDGQGLEQPNLLKAVDVCFKLLYILDIHYPWQYYITWEFVQKVLYGIEDNKKGKTSPASCYCLKSCIKVKSRHNKLKQERECCAIVKIS